MCRTWSYYFARNSTLTPCQNSAIKINRKLAKLQRLFQEKEFRSCSTINRQNDERYQETNQQILENTDMLTKSSTHQGGASDQIRDDKPSIRVLYFPNSFNELLSRFTKNSKNNCPLPLQGLGVVFDLALSCIHWGRKNLHWATSKEFFDLQVETNPHVASSRK